MQSMHLYIYTNLYYFLFWDTTIFCKFFVVMTSFCGIRCDSSNYTNTQRGQNHTLNIKGGQKLPLVTKESKKKISKRRKQCRYEHKKQQQIRNENATARKKRVLRHVVPYQLPATKTRKTKEKQNHTKVQKKLLNVIYKNL